MKFLTTIKHPIAFLPMAMSLAALALVIIHVAMYGITHEADEGTPAHIFQLLLIVQVPIVAYFAIRWLPETPRQAIPIMALQAAAALAAIAPVLFLNL
jgi:hypothetical protein